MKIAIVGSRRMTMTMGIARRIERVLRELDEGDTLLVRSPDGIRATSTFETSVALLAKNMNMNVRLITPEGIGRAAVYRRDYELVLASDAVIAYFPVDEEIEGGTWHVVHAAMQKDVPCRAFTLSPDGRAELVGSVDGEPPVNDVFEYNFF